MGVGIRSGGGSGYLRREPLRSVGLPGVAGLRGQKLSNG